MRPLEPVACIFCVHFLQWKFTFSYFTLLLQDNIHSFSITFSNNICIIKLYIFLLNTLFECVVYFHKYMKIK